MIKIRGLKKSFDNTPVLENINLDIEKGKRFGLVGRSGAGKSTLLRCINGLEEYQEGNLFVNGTDVNSLSNKELREFRKEIGMIFQHFSLLDRLNVYDNIALPLRCWKYRENYIDKRVKELVEIIGIEDKLKCKPNELSGGQKQRVAIARALTMEPAILLCDEATSALDPKTSKSISDLIIDINKKLGITIVLVTHEMAVLKNICQEVAILENGILDTVGSVENIFMEQPQSLLNLIGERDIPVLSKGENIEIFLMGEKGSTSIVSRMSRDLDKDFLILNSEMEYSDEKLLGSIVINVQDEDIIEVSNYLREKELKWSKLKGEECIC